MSSAVVSTSAAPSHPFLFDAEPEAEAKKPARRQASCLEPLIANVVQSKIGNRQSIIPLTPASQLEIRPIPETVSCGIPALDVLTGGLPRGCLTEICGPTSSGRTTVLLATLAAAIGRGEFCVMVDASDTFDPHSVAATGADLDRLLWVRCGENSAPDPDKTRSPASEHRLEQALRITDLLLESGGFGMIVLDLVDLPIQVVRRIPLTTWFRFRRAIEYRPTILLANEQQPIAGSCSSLRLQLRPATTDHENTARPTHAHLLTKTNIQAELIRSRLERKPARSVTFASKTAWAG